MIAEEMIAEIEHVLAEGAGDESWMKNTRLGRVPRLPGFPTPAQRRLMGEGPDYLRALLAERTRLLAEIARLREGAPEAAADARPAGRRSGK